ncbi:hypothetical protein [Polymorphospora rubra]|nr:hypothetical protein [Polymorphospora rubra]
MQIDYLRARLRQKKLCFAEFGLGPLQLLDELGPASDIAGVRGGR